VIALLPPPNAEPLDALGAAVGGGSVAVAGGVVRAPALVPGSALFT
jgi:hypothetical protein